MVKKGGSAWEYSEMHVLGLPIQYLFFHFDPAGSAYGTLSGILLGPTHYKHTLALSLSLSHRFDLG